jgi:hypothetical protein
LYLAVVAAIGLAACGKKGPPLAPYPRLPRSPAEFNARRLGGEVYVRFKVPEEDGDGQRPSNVEFVEVYAMTGNPRTLDDFMEYGSLVASVRVRTPPPPVPPPAAPGLPPPPPPPPRPFEPGVEQGAVIVVSETLTPEMSTPILTEAELRRLEDVEVPEARPAPVVRTPLLHVAPAPPVVRYYIAVGVNRRGRYGNITGRQAVPLVDPPDAPSAPVLTYTERDLTIAWEPPPTARHGVEDGTAGAAGEGKGDEEVKETPAAEPAPVAPVPAAAPALLMSRPWFPVIPGSRYNVYDVTPGKTPPPAVPEVAPPAAAAPANGRTLPPIGDEAVVTAPFALTAFPVSAPSLTVARVEYGIERCFGVRMLDVVAGSPIESELSPARCVTMVDTFAPAAPRSLAAVAGEGSISLIWEANSESDLMGYVVLRGEAGDATLKPLTATPIKETTYRDETARPGVRYAYAVQAVDAYKPANVSAESNRVQETAR